MVYKVFVVACIAVLASQVQAHLNPARDQIPRNDVDNLLKKLKEAVDKALLQAQQALDDAKAQINEKANSIEASALVQMQTTEAELETELDAIKQTATDAGVNIDDCLAGNEDTLVNLPTTLNADMVQCANEKIESGVSYAQDALDRIQTIVNEVENIKQEIKDCGHGLSSVKCLAKLAVKIEQDITSLPTRIEADAVATVAMIAQLESKVKDCADSRVSQCQTDGDAIIATISACAGDKIGA